jgi:hypothetical protein
MSTVLPNGYVTLREVNRVHKRPQLVSRDTVIRALDSLYEQTGDRRFNRFVTNGARSSAYESGGQLASGRTTPPRSAWRRS